MLALYLQIISMLESDESQCIEFIHSSAQQHELGPGASLSQESRNDRLRVLNFREALGVLIGPANQPVSSQVCFRNSPPGLKAQMNRRLPAKTQLCR
ncbi:hypothetical protein SKAU_G00268840 [Synaphobranchus kaupii]|uniref:Uncharacterized protein n=1 Tax=Synaphobranchus kaupii TaxID=118154 RepID=A0A9Q1EZU7_SYNKA|nr:hypothetical protein SKAU_G00268840 [Synaphobranchus kaupii]